MSLERHNQRIRASAERYTERGWSILPAVYHGKDHKPDFTEPNNLAVKLGDASGGLIDVDLDHEYAIDIAESFLPYTPSKFGRQSKRRSHWLYFSEWPMASQNFSYRDRWGLDIWVMEIRTQGQHTIFPPSVHGSGELVRWVDESAQPAMVNPNELLDSIRRMIADIGKRVEAGYGPW